MSKAYAYGRQSHKDQVEANEGIPQQGYRGRLYFDSNLAPDGVEWGEYIPDDRAISARNTPFQNRPAGRKLMRLLQRGDHLIIDKIDRLWRSVADFVDLTRTFREQGITLHITNLMGASVKMGTPMGDFMLNLMVSIAQLDSDVTSDRTCAHFAGRRAEGRYPGTASTATPIGVKMIGKKTKDADTRLLVWCPEQRKFMGEIVRLADEEGKTAEEIAGMIRTHFWKLMGKSFFDPKRSWRAISIAKHYWREKQYRALPYFDPNTIRFSVFMLPNDSGIQFRDIGRAEPNDPNPYPFLDGRPIPTLEELRQIAG
jgi:DNA invertase Pin-like site-specific DNA recombinase